jgi:hypothetical protein
MNIIKRILGWIRYRRQSGGWDAFCDDHFKEALEHIKEKYKGFDVGYVESVPFNEDDDDMDEEEFTCGYPGCNKTPTQEIIWMKPFTSKNIKSSKPYVKLE